MKKVFAIALLYGVLLACNNGGQTEKKETDTAVEAGHQHQTKSKTIELNNSVKWKADSITFSNVALLKAIVSGTKKESLENYIQTATQLQSGLNKMVNECKMKGADHEALHLWLEPLLEETKELKNVTTIEDAREKMQEIEEQINLFTQYFE
jgi:CII-binding regulator of phage lambda lysogenization HflD